MRRWLPAVLVAVVSLPVSASAQRVSPPAPKAVERSQVPHGADGKPDLTGVWQAGSTQAGSWDEANAGLGVGGTGRNPAAAAQPSFNDRRDGETAPYQPWAAQKVLEAFNRRAIDDPSALCLPLGVPRAGLLGLFPIQIVQTPQRVVILYEYMSSFRVISMNGKHPEDLLPSYMGNSVGHWEGDTLVVDVVGFNDKTWLAGAGTFHSDSMHVVERYTRVSKDQIRYDVTIEDPQVLTKPWIIHSSMMLRDGTRLEEYVCAENNLDPGQYEKLLKEGVKFTRE